MIEKVLPDIIKLVLGVLIGALLTWLLAKARTAAGLPKRVERLDMLVRVLLDGIRLLVKLTARQNDAHEATLEALQNGKCNGKASEALKRLTDCREEMDTFLQQQIGGCR
jgi:hypothetical protein